MNGVYLLLIAVALIGLLPLAVILIKKRRADRILANGLKVQASVFHVYTTMRNSADIAHYQFQDSTRQVFTGKLTTRVGLYKPGDIIEIYYLQDNPKKNTVRGSWNSKFIIGFGIVIALGVWFMVYKLYEMLRDGQV